MTTFALCALLGVSEAGQRFFSPSVNAPVQQYNVRSFGYPVVTTGALSPLAAPRPASTRAAADFPALPAWVFLGSALLGFGASAAASRHAACGLGGEGAVAEEEIAVAGTEEEIAALRARRLAGSHAGRVVEKDLLLRVARGEKTEAVPKWRMRQAGRYLPEFRAARVEKNFFGVCRDPILSTELTLQPLRRYPDLDACIIFSDILVIPQAMGMPCEMRPGIGPVFPEPLTDLSQLDLKIDVDETLGYVMDAIFHLCEKQTAVPVWGFSGAPWTLMSYMVEGRGGVPWHKARRWLYERPEESKKLLRAISVIIVDYLVAQLDAGASMVQVFDTNAGELPPHLYEEFCVDDLKWIAEQIKAKRPEAIVAVFPRNAALDPFNDSAYDVVGVSWTVNPEDARAAVPDKVLQGNLDPVALYSPECLEKEVQRMSKGFGDQRWIANLGHGMLPDHTPEAAGKYVELITKL